jgi:hypothetical protein
MAQHAHYWSCSKFADWIRGTAKLQYGTSEEWDSWNTTAKMKHNFRFWIAEEALGHLQDFVTIPTRAVHSLKYYINNRWVSRTHSLTAHPRDIKPGQWRDVGNRFLPCLFNELVDFVEIESAWSHIAWGDKEAKAKYNPPFYASGWWRWRVWRSAAAGIDHLDWAMKLVIDDSMGVGKDDPDFGKTTQQAIRATEIKDLYTWWTVTYRNRPDPHDASGWSAHCDAMRLNSGSDSIFAILSPKNSEDRDASDIAHALLQEIEASYDKEDTDMMIRLIRIRDSLWT